MPGPRLPVLSPRKDLPEEGAWPEGLLLLRVRELSSGLGQHSEPPVSPAQRMTFLLSPLPGLDLLPPSPTAAWWSPS